MESLKQSPKQSPSAQTRQGAKVGSSSVENNILDLKQHAHCSNNAGEVRHELDWPNGLDESLPRMNSHFTHNPMLVPQNEHNEVAEGLRKTFQACEVRDLEQLRSPNSRWAKANLWELPPKQVQGMIKHIRGKPARLLEAFKESVVDRVMPSRFWFGLLC